MAPSPRGRLDALTGRWSPRSISPSAGKESPLVTNPLAALLVMVAVVLASCGGEAERDHARSYVVEGLRTAEDAEESIDALSVCSFNIRFLGHYKKRENEQLADMLVDYDIVVVQELVAPPSDGTYPDGTDYTSDTEAAAFSAAMEDLGFTTLLSEEDTGPDTLIHKATSATEWWVAYFREDRVHSAPDLPGGFLADDRSAHPIYRRVPYAFGFRTTDANADFVLISVHLDPDDSGVRKNELAAIEEWVDAHDGHERDFIIVGDMNIHDEDELTDATPAGFVSMNSDCWPTNTALGTQGPYDHVMYRPDDTGREIDEDYGFWIVDLLATMEDYWYDSYSEPYPGDTTAYDHNLFCQHYSDHHPVEFRIVWPGVDDD